MPFASDAVAYTDAVTGPSVATAVSSTCLCAWLVHTGGPWGPDVMESSGHLMT